MSGPEGTDDDDGEVVTRARARGCRQQALTTRPGVAGKKRLVDSYHSRRTSAPAGGPAASVDGQRLLRWYSRAEEPGGPRHSVAPCDQEGGPSSAAGSPGGTVLVFWL
ncbi:hypothetical protein MRX96_045007 [Rhipicephalus microplus]